MTINDIISKCKLVFFSHFKINGTKMRVFGDDADCFLAHLIEQGCLLRISQ